MKKKASALVRTKHDPQREAAINEVLYLAKDLGGLSPKLFACFMMRAVVLDQGVVELAKPDPELLRFVREANDRLRRKVRQMLKDDELPLPPLSEEDDAPGSVQ